MHVFRICIFALLPALLFGLSGQCAFAFNKAKKIQLVIPWIGGDSHTVAIKFAPMLSRHLGGIPVELKYIRGNSGHLALSYMMNANPDGETIMFASSLDLIYRTIDRPDYPRYWDKLNVVDFVAFQSLACYTSVDSTVRDYASFISALKSKKTDLHITTYSRLSTLFPTYILRKLGYSIKDIPVVFVNSNLPMDEFMRDEQNALTCQTLASLVRIREKMPVNPIFTNHLTSITQFEGMKTTKQIGIKDAEEFRYWTTILAPPNTAKETLQLLRTAMKKLKDDPEWGATLKTMYAVSAIGKIENGQKFLTEQQMFFEKIAVFARWVD